MTRIFAAVAVLFVASAANAQLTGSLALVDTDIETFDPAIFGPGPNVDVWHVSIQNDFAENATSLNLALNGPWQNFNSAQLSFQDNTNLPVLGPNTVAESFFVLPAGTTDLAVGTVDDGSTLTSNYTVAGDTALVPAGGSSVVAVLTTLAGDFTEADITTILGGFSGQAAVAGQFEDISFIPEPTTALLAGLAMVGFVARRR